MKKRLRIAIIAGEASGDILGAGLIQALKEQYPSVEFEGIGGPLMIANGFRSLFPMEKLSVMGLVEVLKHLPEILSIRRKTIQYLLKNPPDMLIGIDAPDFCLTVEARLKAHGIKTIHYVSPTVWVWREKRVFKIKKAADLVLCLFPFEPDFYARYQVDAEFVGHTLADQIPMDPDQNAARRQLGLSSDVLRIAVLPGSRRSEVERLGSVFFEAAQRVQQIHPGIEFIIPCATPTIRSMLEQQLKNYLGLRVTLFDGQSRVVMTAADLVLLASGTAALEAMLLKKPMVVSYIMSPLTWFLVKRMVKTQWASLPNILAKRSVVPELLQYDATAEKIADELLTYLENSDRTDQLMDTFKFIHKQLRRDADQVAANAVLKRILSETDDHEK
ncbi:lipid-A-disaccharide synthase [Gynuella sunshinyii]|uniref:Lipid-A-disaccharide synthase n=1 Tax=Gynuella sunshinyii YC6258 TaxID=1445510 RepID=A0A0C5VK84_9GAMM|nr:lipid-A-disaccharide synthase [Gynuella sunshinyii]AJQ94686.1 lipid A disaccharide synthetase [Gynuella sunshinyii YC6258]